MNYQHKYFKYKSKYLEKKYGHIQIFSYKIDNNNDLDYKQKYFKYKSKYLNIKYGGNLSGKLAFAFLPREVRQAIRGAELLGSIVNVGAKLVAQKLAPKTVAPVTVAAAASTPVQNLAPVPVPPVATPIPPVPPVVALINAVGKVTALNKAVGKATIAPAQPPGKPAPLLVHK